jgi:hypothetical protein
MIYMNKGKYKSALGYSKLRDSNLTIIKFIDMLLTKAIKDNNDDLLNDTLMMAEKYKINKTYQYSICNEYSCILDLINKTAYCKLGYCKCSIYNSESNQIDINITIAIEDNNDDLLNDSLFRCQQLNINRTCQYIICYDYSCTQNMITNKTVCNLGYCNCPIYKQHSK